MKHVIYGAGGHGAVVLDCLRSANLEVIGFLDDSPELAGTKNCGLPVLGTLAASIDLLRREQAAVVPGIGDIAMRRQICEEVAAAGLVLAGAVHASALVSPSAVVGAGTVLCPGAIVNARSRIGRGCIVNTGASVDHDCELGDFVHVSPGAHLGGNVVVGPGTMLGLGLAVIPHVKIGAWSVVGAGSVVVRNIPEKALAYGNPARVKRCLL